VKADRLRACALTLVLAAIGAATSCAASRSWWSPPACRFEPVSSDDLPGDLALRARSRFEVRGETVGVELVARTRPDGLVVLGLSGYGVRLFAVEQRGREMAIDASTGEERALASFAMDALHRAFWIRPPAEAGSPEQASQSWQWGGERVSQTRSRAGARRRYESELNSERNSERNSEAVTIDYPQPATVGDEEAAPQQAIVVRNPRCGYEAVIIPLSVTFSGWNQAPTTRR
jgi:hypothetical protein